MDSSWYLICERLAFSAYTLIGEPEGTHNIDITQIFGYFSLGGGTYCGWVK